MAFKPRSNISFLSFSIAISPVISDLCSCHTHSCPRKRAEVTLRPLGKARDISSSWSFLMAHQTPLCASSGSRLSPGTKAAVMLPLRRCPSQSCWGCLQGVSPQCPLPAVLRLGTPELRCRGLSEERALFSPNAARTELHPPAAAWGRQGGRRCLWGCARDRAPALCPLLESELRMGKQSFSRHGLFPALNQGIKSGAAFVHSVLPACPYMGFFTISGHARNCIIYRQDSQECGSAAAEQLEDTLK